MNSKSTRHGLVLAAMLAVTACSPPTETISAGELAQQSAIAAGAEEYAAEAMASVAQAKASLDAELAAQQGRFVLRRSYRRAEELATTYRTASEQAASAAGAGREQARSDATALIAESRILLGEVRGMLAAAPVGKGSRADLAAMNADLDQAATLITEAETLLGVEEFMEAKSRATSAREAIDGVKSAVEQARGMRAS